MDTGYDTVTWHYYDLQVYQALLSVALIHVQIILNICTTVSSATRAMTRGGGKKKRWSPSRYAVCPKTVTKCVLCSIVEDKIKRSRQPTPCSDAHGERDFGWARRPSLSELSPDHRAVCSRYEDFFPFHSVLNRCMTGNPQDRDVQAIIYIY